MMLTALATYENPDADSAPFGYARKPLGYTLVIWRDGLGCRLVPHHDEQGRAPEGLIPNLARTVKATPFLGCDNAAYVLGRGKASEDGRKTAAKHELFTGLVREFHAATPTPQAEAYLRWVDRGKPGLADVSASLTGAAGKRIDMDPIAIAVEGTRESMHDTPAARAFWARRARSGKEGADRALCVVCGMTKPPVATLPQSLVGHLVPGATQANVALASVNFPSASRGASGLGLRSAPICADCAALAVQNLNSLAASTKHAWRSPGGESALVWWTTDPAADPLVLLITQAQPELVAGLLGAPHGARPEKLWHPGPDDKFLALSFSGNVARFVVRRWMELPLRDVHRNIVTWFADVETANSEHRHFPLFRYTASLGPMRREQGKWLTPPPHGAVEALLMTALADAPVPPHFLRLALTRASAEVRLCNSDDKLAATMARRRMEARVGVVRLILNRSISKENPMPSHLDENRRDPAYISGRLFAVRESLQYSALGKVNASIVDKFYERASSHPAAVAQHLDVLSKQHLKTIRRERGEGAYLRENALISELNSLQGDAPGRLSAEEQAAWLCGYHQQRMHDIESAQARKAARKTGLLHG